MNRSPAGWGVLVSVPLAYALMLALPEHGPVELGVPTALGCSGTGNVSSGPPPLGWTELRPALHTVAEPSVPIATDGFFTIAGTQAYPSAGEPSSVMVEVKDEAGTVVPGEARVLREDPPGYYLYGWEAQAPIAIGTKLTATLTATPVYVTAGEVGGTFALEVVSEPTALTAPTATLTNWATLFHGEGASVPCRTYCNAKMVPANHIEQTGAYPLWTPPKISGGVAWEVRVEASSSEADAVPSERPHLHLASGTEPELLLGRVRFPTKADRHCVQLVIKDLRTEATVANEVCEQTGDLGRLEADTDLSTCEENPTEAAREAWCRLRHRRQDPECAAFFGATGTAGSSTGTAGSNTGTSGPPPSSGSRTSSGCQFGGLAGSSGYAAAVLALLAFARRRRRST